MPAPPESAYSHVVTRGAPAAVRGALGLPAVGLGPLPRHFLSIHETGDAVPRHPRHGARGGCPRAPDLTQPQTPDLPGFPEKAARQSHSA